MTVLKKGKLGINQRLFNPFANLLSEYISKAKYSGLIQPIKDSKGKYKDLLEVNMGSGINAKDHIEYADLKEFLLSLSDLGFKEAVEAIKEEEL
ncbi:MAG TPA: hypothetical protein PK129_04375 [Cellvibrionaceae bacterium]|nr:hypothetical protein [Cellvibrionaceae bacterium]